MKKILRLGSVQVSLFIFLFGFVFFSGVSFAAEKIEIIEFSATWCGPCQKIKLSVEAFAESINNNPKSNQDYIVRLVDVDEKLDQFGVSYDGPIPKAIPAMRYNHVTSNNVQGVMDRVSEQIREKRPPPGPSSPAPDLIQIISETSKQMPSADFQITGMYGEKTDKGFKVHAIVLKIDGRDDPVVVDIDINSTESLSGRVGVATRNFLVTLPAVAPNPTPVPAPTPQPPATLPFDRPLVPVKRFPKSSTLLSPLTTPLSFEKFRESKSKKLTKAINDGIRVFDSSQKLGKLLIALSSDKTIMKIQFKYHNKDVAMEIMWSPVPVKKSDTNFERPDTGFIRRSVTTILKELKATRQLDNHIPAPLSLPLRDRSEVNSEGSQPRSQEEMERLQKLINENISSD